MRTKPQIGARINRKMSRYEFAPPSNLEAEQALLGAILVNNEALREVDGLITSADFAEPIHAEIFKTCARVIADGRKATAVTLRNFFPAEELAPGMTPLQYLARLAAEATTIVNAPDYARAVKSESVKRAAMAVGADLREILANPRADLSPIETISDAAAELQKIAEGGATHVDRTDAADGAAGLIQWAEAVSRGEVKHDVVRTGFPSLDRTIGGYQPGTLVIVGARPGMGKTAFACASARRVASEGAGAAIFSLEVPAKQISARVLSDLTFHNGRAISFGDLLRGKIDIHDQDGWFLRNAQARLAEWPLSYFDPTSVSVADIALRVRQEKRRLQRRGHRLGVVFIDYLKFVKASGRYSGQRHYEVGEITAGLKQLAKDEEICVVLLAQLSRAIESRDRNDRRPTLSDLRESGDIEADADVVIFLYRGSYYIEQSPDFKRQDANALREFARTQFDAELIVEKNRSGPKRTIVAKSFMATSSLFEGEFSGIDSRRAPVFSGLSTDDTEQL